MSDEKGKSVKEGFKEGAKVAGKVVKWVIIAVVLIIVAVCAYSCYACSSVTKAVVDATADSKIVKEAVRDAKGGDDKTKMASEAISVTAVDLYKAYESNAVRADNTYKGKYVRVTGKVGGVDQDLITKKPYVKLKTENQFLDLVYIYFKETEITKVSNLDVGQTITIVGNCDGKSVMSVDVKDSFFE